jgi:O-antigen/teichoic acid export membrane protein
MTGSRSPLRQFLHSSGAMAVLYAGATGLTLVVGVVLARLLGAQGYGTYALAMTVVTLAGIVTEFGLPVLAMREAGAARAHGNWAEVKGLLVWADRTILIFSALLAIGTVAYHFVLGTAQSTGFLAAILWGVALVPVVAIGKLRSLVLLALDHVFASQLPVMILRPLVFIAACGAIWWQDIALTAPLAMAAQLAAAISATLVVAALFRRDRPAALASAGTRFAVRRWLASCLPMGLTEGLRLLQGQMALLLVGLLAGAAAAGIYRVGDAVMQMTTLVTSVVATAATPLFSRLMAEDDRAGITRIAVLGAWAMLGGTAALGLPLALLGHWIFPMVFGAEFAASLPVFLILWAGTAVSTTFGLALPAANMTGHHVLSTQSFGVIAALNLTLGAAAIPQFGAVGAAFASAVSLVAGTAFCALRLNRRTGINCSLFNRNALAQLGQGVSFGRDWAANRLKARE